MTANTSAIVGLTSSNSNLLPITFQPEFIGKSAIINTSNINVQIGESSTIARPLEKPNQNSNELVQSTKIPINFENDVSVFEDNVGLKNPSPYTLRMTRLSTSYFLWTLGVYTPEDEIKYGNPLIECAPAGGPYPFMTIPTLFRDFQNVNKKYTPENISYSEDRVNIINVNSSFFISCQLYVGSIGNYAFRIQDLTRNITLGSTGNTGNIQKITFSGWTGDFYDEGTISIAVQCRKITSSASAISVGFPVNTSATYDGLQFLNFQIIQIY